MESVISSDQSNDRLSSTSKSGICIICGKPMKAVTPSLTETRKLECSSCNVVVQIWDEEEVKKYGEQKRKAFRKKETKVRTAKAKDSSKQSKTKSKVRKVK